MEKIKKYFGELWQQLKDARGNVFKVIATRWKNRPKPPRKGGEQATKPKAPRQPRKPIQWASWGVIWRALVVIMAVAFTGMMVREGISVNERHSGIIERAFQPYIEKAEAQYLAVIKAVNAKGVTYVVTKSGVNIRPCANRDNNLCKPLRKTQQGEELQIVKTGIGTDGKWCQIAGQPEMYISCEFLKIKTEEE